MTFISTAFTLFLFLFALAIFGTLVIALVSSGCILAGVFLSALAFVLNDDGVIVLVFASCYCLFVHLLTPSNSPIRTAGWMPFITFSLFFIHLTTG